MITLKNWQAVLGALGFMGLGAVIGILVYKKTQEDEKNVDILDEQKPEVTDSTDRKDVMVSYKNMLRDTSLDETSFADCNPNRHITGVSYTESGTRVEKITPIDFDLDEKERALEDACIERFEKIDFSVEYSNTYFDAGDQKFHVVPGYNNPTWIEFIDEFNKALEEKGDGDMKEMTKKFREYGDAEEHALMLLVTHAGKCPIRGPEYDNTYFKDGKFYVRPVYNNAKWADFIKELNIKLEMEGIVNLMSRHGTYDPEPRIVEDEYDEHGNLIEEHYDAVDGDEEDEEDEDDRLNREAEELFRNKKENPYLITYDDFVDGVDGYDKLTLLYFEGDRVVTEEDEVPVNNYEYILGTEFIVHVAYNSENAYIRNDSTMTLYEIIAISDSYEKNLAGLVETPKERAERLRRRDELIEESRMNNQIIVNMFDV